MKIDLPHGWEPRDYQSDFWRAMFSGTKRALLCWHRRAGKDLTAFNWSVIDMVKNHPGGQWWHVWPTYEQGRKGWWEGADNKGRRFLDYIPPELVRRKRDDMMMVELANDSIYRVVGAEDPDRLVGANPVGLIMTEYSLQNPAAWDYLRPILAANEGTAIFPFTPRGRNHAHKLLMDVRKNPDWFTSVLGIEDTNALPMSVVEEERAAGMTEELIRQEYYVSFNAPLSGAYYSREMDRAREEKRITRVPYDQHLGVETWWDIGIGDATAIWFVQRLGSEYRFIDYEEDSGRSLHDWIKVVTEKPYFYHGHIGPHDLAAREMSTGKSRARFAEELGLRFHIAPKHLVDEGIDAVRRMLPQCWFDEDKCWRGIEALLSYRKKWDDARQVYSDNPLHDWSSHAADAIRTGAVASSPKKTKTLPRKYSTRYDPYEASRPYARAS